MNSTILLHGVYYFPLGRWRVMRRLIIQLGFYWRYPRPHQILWVQCTDYKLDRPDP